MTSVFLPPAKTRLVTICAHVDHGYVFLVTSLHILQHFPLSTILKNLISWLHGLWLLLVRTKLYGGHQSMIIEKKSLNERING